MADKSDNETKEQPKSVETASTPGDPFAPLVDLRERMDRLFDDVMGRWGSLGALPRPSGASGLEAFPEAIRGLWPAASLGGNAVDVKFDVSDSAESVEITAELPGMKEDEVDLTMADGVLTIKGEKKVEREEKEKDYFVTERQFGAFRRAFRVPESVDAEKVAATFNDGVLNVSLPKRPEAKAKQKKIAISKSS